MPKKTTLILLLLIIGSMITGLVLAFAFNPTGLREVNQNSCRGQHGTSREIVIVHSIAANRVLTGKHCDTVTFRNEDTIIREIGFGPHDNHQAYDGVAEKILGSHESFTITLDRVGTYHWHDHLHDDIEGYFTVTP